MPRQCIFVGTTNEKEYLADATGARRFWPVRLGRIDLPALQRDRDQLWAEADALYLAGAAWWPDAALDALGADEQDDRREDDPWTARLTEWLASPCAKRRLEGGSDYVEPLDPNEGVTMAEVLTHALAIPTERQDKRTQCRVAELLRSLGWSRGKRRRESNDVVRRWTRKAGH